VAAAEADIALAVNQAREELRASVASLAVLGASKILEREVDADTHRELLDKLIAEI
jgi:F-type H+-transporting ATPase subunit b